MRGWVRPAIGFLFASWALPFPSLFPSPFLNAAHSLYLGGSTPPVSLNFFPLPFPFLFFLPISLPYLPPSGPVHRGTALGLHLPIAQHHRFNSSSGGVSRYFPSGQRSSVTRSIRPTLNLIPFRPAYSPSDSYLTSPITPSWALISTRSKLLLP
jgi:hypothetical protein